VLLSILEREHKPRFKNQALRITSVVTFLFVGRLWQARKNFLSQGMVFAMNSSPDMANPTQAPPFSLGKIVPSKLPSSEKQLVYCPAQPDLVVPDQNTLLANSMSSKFLCNFIEQSESLEIYFTFF
jgi:hypothetical protein